MPKSGKVTVEPTYTIKLRGVNITPREYETLKRGPRRGIKRFTGETRKAAKRSNQSQERTKSIQDGALTVVVHVKALVKRS